MEVGFGVISAYTETGGRFAISGMDMMPRFDALGGVQKYVPALGSIPSGICDPHVPEAIEA
jgi:hypothetical protein